MDIISVSVGLVVGIVFATILTYLLTKSHYDKKDVKKETSEKKDTQYNVNCRQFSSMFTKQQIIEVLKELQKEENNKDVKNTMIILEIRNKNAQEINQDHTKSYFNLLRQQFRYCDAIGRYDDGKFIILMFDVTSTSLIKLRAKKVNDNIISYTKRNNIDVSLNMGITIFPCESTFEEAESRCLENLNIAKNTGDNRFWLDSNED